MGSQQWQIEDKESLEGQDCTGQNTVYNMQERFVNLQYQQQEGKLKIRYLESDNDNLANHQQPHILFIHGLGSSSDRWLDIPDALSMYFHTIAIDLPGFGGSDKPSDMDYTIEAFSNIVTDFIVKIGIAGKEGDDSKAGTTLVGHSLGGYIASKIVVADNRHLVDKLVLIDSSGNLKKPTPLLEQYLDAAMTPSKEKVRKVFQQMVANPLIISDALVYGFIDRMNKPNAKYAFESSIRNSANTQIGIKTLNKIGDKGIPTMILWGMEDKVIPTYHSQIFKEAIKDSTVTIIPRTGHAPFSEKPALVCEYLHRFLAK
jgi:2-hydroxy-6-oxonona-2,4-dienedioate hydrolase